VRHHFAGSNPELFVKSLLSYFINNPFTGNVATVFVLAAGVLMFANMRSEQFPQVDEPGVTVYAECPGLTPAEIERRITLKIEDALKGTEGVESIVSESFDDYCVLTVNFDDDARIDRTKDALRRDLDSIGDFPGEMSRRPIISGRGSKHDTVLNLAVSGDVPYGELLDIAEDLQERIGEIAAVAEVQRRGSREREIQIRADLVKMSRSYMSFDEIRSAIISHNVRLSGGKIRSPLEAKSVVTLLEPATAADLGDIIIRSNLNGDRILLSDVAETVESFERKESEVRINGREAIILAVHKKEKSDVVRCAAEIRTLIDAYRRGLKDKSVELTIIYDSSALTASRIRSVEKNIVMALVLVIVVLALFLNFKTAFWSAVGIPFSLCMASALLSLTGITINSVTLLAVIMVLGMLVDDAIVIAENIHRHHALSGGSAGVTAGAVAEVAFPVLTSVLTTLIAFFPLLAIEGEIGRYLREVPLVVSVLLISSLVEAFFILPAHLACGLSSRKKFFLGFAAGASSALALSVYLQLPPFAAASVVLAAALAAAFLFVRFYDGEKRGGCGRFQRFSRLYAGAVELLLRGRYALLAVFIVVVCAAAVQMSTMKFEMFPQGEGDVVKISGDAANSRSLESTSAKLKSVEQRLITRYGTGGIKSVMSVCGVAGRSERFEMTLFLESAEQRRLPTAVLLDGIRGIFDGGEFRDVRLNLVESGPEAGSSIAIEVHGNDDSLREKLVESVIGDLRAIDGVYSAVRAQRADRSGVVVSPDAALCAQRGVDVRTLAEVLRFAYQGSTVTSIESGGRDIACRLIADQKSTESVEAIASLLVMSAAGEMEQIGDLVRLHERAAVNSIRRYNGKRTASVSAEFDPIKISAIEVYNQLERRYGCLGPEYPGLRVHLGGDAEREVRMLGSLKRTMLLCVAAIFVLMVFLFKSLSQPLVVMISVVFAFVGVVAALSIHAMPFSFMGIMGMTGLAGVAVNGAIVMVDYVNTQMRDSAGEKCLREIIVLAAVTRLRPIVLTTLTTFAGLVPCAYGWGGRDSFIVPAAMCLSWGLLVSMVLVLLLLPALIMIESDVRGFFAKIFGSVR